mmetsp:Transcript_692/g.1747  ORF Transcript_692/g.1747 Transcript_692/m.1747 type:complete len:143 (-) Transcript_692:2904-3332(-)
MPSVTQPKQIKSRSFNPSTHVPPTRSLSRSLISPLTQTHSALDPSLAFSQIAGQNGTQAHTAKQRRMHLHKIGAHVFTASSIAQGKIFFQEGSDRSIDTTPHGGERVFLSGVYRHVCFVHVNKGEVFDTMHTSNWLCSHLRE